MYDYPNEADHGYRSTVSVSVIEQAAQAGALFEFGDLSDSVPNLGGTFQWILHTGNRVVRVYQRRVQTSSDNWTYLVTRGVSTTDDGTEITPNNRKCECNELPLMKIYRSPTGVTGGTPLFPEYLRGDPGGGPAEAKGQFIAEGEVRVLEKNTKYSLTVTNNGTVDGALADIFILFTEAIK